MPGGGKDSHSPLRVGLGVAYYWVEVGFWASVDTSLAVRVRGKLVTFPCLASTDPTISGGTFYHWTGTSSHLCLL